MTDDQEFDDQGTATAQPAMIDTGSFFVETKICTNCKQPIEKTLPKPARKQAWVHSHSKSAQCYR